MRIAREAEIDGIKDRRTGAHTAPEPSVCLLLTRRQLLALASGTALTALIGCGARKRETNIPAKRVGLPFIVLIVDCSGSTASIQAAISAYAKAAMDEYVREERIKVLVVSLNEKPDEDFQRENVGPDEVDDVVGHVKKMNLNARGTDIIGAFDTALRYYGYEKLPPVAFKILCFTDGYIDAPKGRKFRDWMDFDWTRLNAAGARVGLYFIDPAVRDKVEQAIKPLSQAFVESKKDALYDLQQDDPQLP